MFVTGLIVGAIIGIALGGLVGVFVYPLIKK
jgi:large-conductance mechanosensitive channel